MPGEIIQRPQVTEKGKHFETGAGLENIKDFESRAKELKDVKDKIQANVDKMNKRLQAALGKEKGFLSMFEDVLSPKELQNAVEVVDGEMDQLEADFNAKLIAVNKAFEGPTNTQDKIVNALKRLNGKLEKYITGRLETVISEADWTDGNKQKLLAKLYPQPEEDTGEEGKESEDLFKAGKAAFESHRTGRGGKHDKIAKLLKEAE